MSEEESKEWFEAWESLAKAAMAVASARAASAKVAERYRQAKEKPAWRRRYGLQERGAWLDKITAEDALRRAAVKFAAHEQQRQQEPA